MKKLIIASLLFVAPSSAYGLSLTNSQVLARCVEPRPEPNPGWQDYFGFKANGPVRKVGNTYTVHGVMFEVPGTCVVSANDVIFKVDNLRQAQLKLAEDSRRSRFAMKCMDLTTAYFNTPMGDGIAYGGEMKVHQNKNGTYWMTGIDHGHAFTCRGTVERISIEAK